ncbi:MAG: helix-turn-helix domain-containing protein [Candidatus Fervidibacter sp.]|uniref:helix-turn-helix domain-containing protein n=1 Tax=Candidatus Fervidibacter sp. TaxID=3100871 RepID=UPI00404A5886
METLQKDYPEFQRLRLYRKDRKRAIGAGGKFKLSLDERVFMTLFFLRHYPVYALLGFLFDLHESNAYRNVEAMKRYQVFGGLYRGRGKGYRETVEMVGGLVNMEAWEV